MIVGCRSTFAIIGVSGETHFRELLGISFLVLVSLFFLKVHGSSQWKSCENSLGSAIFLIWQMETGPRMLIWLAHDCTAEWNKAGPRTQPSVLLGSCSLCCHSLLLALSVLTYVTWMGLGCVDCTWPHFPTSQDALRIPGEKSEAYENKLDADPVPPGMHTDLTNHLSFTHICSLSRCSSNLMTSTSSLVVNNPQTSFRNGCKHTNAELHLTSHQHTSWRLLMEPFLH